MRRLFAAAALLLPAAAAAAGSPGLDEEEIAFLVLINEYRAEHGLPCLSVSPTLNQAADWMSEAMGTLGFFSHNEPPCDEDGCTGRDPFERMRDFGHVGWTAAAENIAAGYSSALAAFEGWKRSPGHNANMLSPHLTAIGIGRVEVPGSTYGVYWTTPFSNLVDGTHRCEEGLPPLGYGAPDDPGEEAGDGPAKEEDGGCSSASGGLSLLALGVGLQALRRRL